MSDATIDARSTATHAPSPALTLTHLDNLPTLAPIAVRMLELTSNADADIRDLTNVLRGDQSLTAKILSVANSGAFGARGRITSLDQALVRLGFRMVRNVVLAVTVFGYFPEEPAADADQDRLDRTEFWKHSLAVALLSQRIARRIGNRSVLPDEAFLAGLLHDLGKVALDAVFPKAYRRVVARAAQNHSDVTDAEHAILGVDHTVAGRRLAERWKLPSSLRDVIWLHHVAVNRMSSGAVATDLITVVRIADTYVREHRVGQSGNYAFYESAAQVGAALGISQSELDEELPGLISEVAQLAAELGLGEETSERLYLQSLSRANAELGRLNGDLLKSNRKLEATARYFDALTAFNQALHAYSDLPGVLRALLDAATHALGLEQLAVFCISEQQEVVEFCFADPAHHLRDCHAQVIEAEFAEWLSHPGEALSADVLPAPQPVRAMLVASGMSPSAGECWLLPIKSGSEIRGGIIFFSRRDERITRADELAELRLFLASISIAFAQVHAQSAARILTEDLAETNRRLQQSQAELLRTRTLSMVAEMAAGAGHELNSPLTVISGRAQMLRETIQDDSATRVLDVIHEKAHECSRIVAELMDFARPLPPKLVPMELASILMQSHASWVERSALTAERLQLDLPQLPATTEPPRVAIDRAQFQIVLDELIENATHAVAENEGVIHIGLRYDDAQSPPGLRRREPTDVGWVEIVVRDTGVGMPADVAERAFDPFFSHRPAGRGRGLGLARAYRIVEAHGGRLWVDSRPGEGSTFHIVLPRAVAQ